jgi:hypothetical protein
MLMTGSTMTHRLQILIDEPRYALLERESRRTGRPIAELIREAVDASYGVDREKRRAAADRLLAADPMPVDDWDVMQQEMMDEFSEPPP